MVTERAHTKAHIENISEGYRQHLNQNIANIMSINAWHQETQKYRTRNSFKTQ